MSTAALNIAELVECALAMPHAERSYLATKLISSLDDDDDIEVSQEWRDELNRRVEDMRNGTSPGIPHEEVMREVRELLASIRKEKQAAA
jgi:putative addiction module component (TIGR02574 family)